MTALRLNPVDDVALAVDAIAAGAPVAYAGGAVLAVEPVPAGHKIAVRDLAAGHPVLKYGQVIGVTTRAVRAGEHVHTHNLAYDDALPRAAAGSSSAGMSVAPTAGTGRGGATFEGYRRADGRVGTRNYLGVVSTVNCSATAAKRIAARLTDSGVLDDYPNVDGVVALTHGTGCGMQPEGVGLDLLRRTLGGYLRHPNFAGLLVLGLGCEDNQPSRLLSELPSRSDRLVEHGTIQQLGGTRAAIAEGVEQLTAMLPAADRARRETAPATELILATNCGGSDGYSGVTANPALGFALDRLIEAGGTGVLAETPEIVGAEHLLAARTTDPGVADDLYAKIDWWRRYTAANGGSLDNNPSPGNKAGGLTTILEKSLGAVSKGGTTPLRAVVDYAAPIPRPGLVFMDTPGYDPVSVTGLVAGGANLVCFTTGRGSAFGAKPVPSIKLATNSALYERMRDDMDVDCGRILSGVPIEVVAEEIFQLVLATASGRWTRSEELGLGDEEFVPWQLGAVM